MLPQFPQRRRGRGPPAALRLLRQHLDRAVHADGKDLIHLGQVGIDAAMLDVRPVAPDARLDQLAILGVCADLTRQRQKAQRLFKVHRLRDPALRQARAGRFRRLFRRLAALDVRPEPAGFQPDLVARILAQHLIGDPGLVAVHRRERARISAVGIVGAADERPARPRGLEAQPPFAAGRAEARVRPVRTRRIKMGREEFVDLLQHLADAQICGFRDGGGEIAPEPGQNVLVVPLPGGDVVKLLLQIGGEVVFDVAAKIVRQERRHQPALVLGDQAVLVLAHIFPVLDGRDDGGIGRRPTDPQFLHPLDQRRFGIARRCLREMLFRRDLALVGGLAFHDLRQAGAVLALIVVAALVIDLEEAVEHHHLPGGAQFDLRVGRADIDRRPLQPCRRHLAGDGALPDQVVELPLIVGDLQLVG